jgi:hypothetical protein
VTLVKESKLTRENGSHDRRSIFCLTGGTVKNGFQIYVLLTVVMF